MGKKSCQAIHDFPGFFPVKTFYAPYFKRGKGIRFTRCPSVRPTKSNFLTKVEHLGASVSYELLINRMYLKKQSNENRLLIPYLKETN